MNKKDVPDVVRIKLNYMAKLDSINNDFIAWNVKRHMFGMAELIASSAGNTGLSYGLPRVTRSGGYASFPDIVPLNLKGLRITGFHKCPRKESIIPKSDIWSSMVPISIKMGVY